MRVIYGFHACECGNEFEWKTYVLENGEMITGRIEKLRDNVKNLTKIYGSYTIEIQCPKCRARHFVEENTV